MGTYILPRFLISKLRSKETTPFLESIPPEQEELEFERFCDLCGAKIRPIFNDSNELIQCIILDKSMETVKKALAWGRNIIGGWKHLRGLWRFSGRRATQKMSFSILSM